MKLALYLPNFRDHVTVKELEDLTALAEALDFDSVWTLDRIVVPEASDRQQLQHSFGMMEQFPKALPVSARGQWLHGMPLIPWLAAKTRKLRIGMSIIDTPYRAPGVLAGEIATVDHLSNGRVNVGLGSGWMPEEFAAASAAHLFPKRHKHVRETIEVLQGIWTNEVFEYHGEFADFEPCGFGAKPIQRPHPPIYFSGLKDPKRSARRIAKYGLAGWIGIQDTPEEIVRWRSEIQRELVEMGSSRSLDDGFDMCAAHSGEGAGLGSGDQPVRIIRKQFDAGGQLQPGLGAGTPQAEARLQAGLVIQRAAHHGANPGIAVEGDHHRRAAGRTEMAIQAHAVGVEGRVGFQFTGLKLHGFLCEHGGDQKGRARLPLTAFALA